MQVVIWFMSKWADHFLRFKSKLAGLMRRVPCMLRSLGDLGSIPGLGRYPREGNGNALHYLAWRTPWTEEPSRLQSIGSKSQTQLSNLTLSLSLWILVSIIVVQMSNILKLTFWNIQRNITKRGSFLWNGVLREFINIPPLAIFQGKVRKLSIFFQDGLSITLLKIERLHKLSKSPIIDIFVLI